MIIQNRTKRNDKATSNKTKEHKVVDMRHVVVDMRHLSTRKEKVLVNVISISHLSSDLLPMLRFLVAFFVFWLMSFAVLRFTVLCFRFHEEPKKERKGDPCNIGSSCLDPLSRVS